jgi:hypothetical protein
MKAGIVGGVVAVGIAVTAGSVALSGSVLRPPSAFHGDTWAVVQWQDITQVDAACRDLGAAGDGRIQGCAKGRMVILPNPCRLTGFYADVSCHEMAHLNGYRHK